jgi:glycosyltransferase involved in cell wall biosynthesis
MNELEVSVVMPCLNEAATVRTCIEKARACLQRLNVVAEIIIADNGSTDGSQQLARNAGARVIHVQQRGYGAALRAGIEAAHGRYVIMGDADDSYDFGNLEPFVEKLRGGEQLVMGNRFAGGIGKGAMPLLHRYLGNPVLSFLGRLFFKVPIGDFHCGLRAFDRRAILQLGLATSGMEFASEMVVKAGLAQLRIAEVPTTLSQDGRDRAPHLRTWRDGWRHLRFLLIFSPRWLFLYPGTALLMLGTFLQSWLLHGSVKLGSLGLDIHTLLYAAAMSVVGTQMIWFAVLAKVYGMRLGFSQKRTARLENALRILTLERGVAVGLTLLAGGLVLSVHALVGWADTHYGALDPREVMRTAIPSVSMLLIGMEFVLASFFLGILRIEHGEIVPQQVIEAHPTSASPSSANIRP